MHSFIAWERCDGTLEDIVKKTYTGFAVGSMKQILCQIGNGLKYLHQNGIIHCDIRPSTIFISKPLRNTDERPKMKIAKFGQSERVLQRTEEDIENKISSDVANKLESRTPDSLGWIEPMAHIMPSEFEFTKKSDVFSFGLLCGYASSSGQHPFGQNDKDRQRNLKEENYNMDCFQSLDPSLLDLVERAINISKSDRPSMETILNLPYFWTDKKSLDYFVTIFNDQLNVKNSIHRTELEGNGQMDIKVKVLNTNWRTFLKNESPQVEAMADRSYDGESIFHLIRFIRNKVRYNLLTNC